MKIIQEFKEFAMRGSVIDLAVGVIIGGAFGKIVSSLVENVLMPPIGLLIGGVDFSSLKIILKPAVINSSGTTTATEVAINYGNFLQASFDFIIVAFVIFMFVKMINSVHKKKATPPPAPAAPSEDIVLLTQIRDLLKEKQE